MRIYPDPDLPDVRVEWFVDFDCRSATDVAVAAIYQLDPVTEIRALAAPCVDGALRLVDVPRAPLLVTTTLEDAAGAALRNAIQAIDLSDGRGERVYAGFGAEVDAFATASWSFAPGASCGSLGADFVDVAFSVAGGRVAFVAGVPCTDVRFTAPVGLEGTVTAQVIARSGERAVAASPPSAEIRLARGAIADFGTLALSPCGADCPVISF
jgi:hypothetical protein